MPENPDMYLHEIRLMVLDDLYDVLKERAAAQSTSIPALVIESMRTGLGLGLSPRLPIETLREKLLEEVSLYAKDAINAKGFLTISEDRNVYVAVHVGTFGKTRNANAGIIARIVKDVIVIECDMNNKMLVDALLQAGVPRAQIILAYTGEPVPETV